VIRLHSVRYGVPVESEHETVEEAVRSAFWEVEHNSAAPGYLTDEQGAVVMDKAALDVAVEQIALSYWRD
jgi:hypothetical protein